MRKVAVVSCKGSGTSHVARELGALLGAPVTYKDSDPRNFLIAVDGRPRRDW
ncbi:hypothetical protein LE181_07935 [Streptomyces sp. SCA3-4]|uniref:hypothetical protein n=1 Tax=Streptomyces sichuanensis TaxID=2871810 RepID=UPI001CE23BD9|nr:hypothetical protein [Streptomyces sichuanensis]MCA6092088.1 hypothetical protein [Streptomyces sichuanensis]